MFWLSLNIKKKVEVFLKFSKWLSLDRQLENKGYIWLRALACKIATFVEFWKYDIMCLIVLSYLFFFNPWLIATEKQNVIYSDAVMQIITQILF